jgi:hypothetical protein
MGSRNTWCYSTLVRVAARCIERRVPARAPQSSAPRQTVPSAWRCFAGGGDHRGVCEVGDLPLGDLLVGPKGRWHCLQINRASMLSPHQRWRPPSHCVHPPATAEDDVSPRVRAWSEEAGTSPNPARQGLGSAKFVYGIFMQQRWCPSRFYMHPWATVRSPKLAKRHRLWPADPWAWRSLAC